MTKVNGNGAAQAIESTRASAPSFPKRFYASVSVEPASEGYAVLLDGRGARTPGRRPLVLPNRALADAVAAEWSAVGDTIDPRAMPVTRLVNTAIDGVSQRPAEVMAEIGRFAGSDLLSYRATEPAELVRAQREAWDPLIDWAERALGARLVLTEGVMHVAQPQASLERFERGLRSLARDDAASPYRVAALHVMTSLTGSAVLAAAVASDILPPEQAWAAAHVDEDYQASQWGEDAEAADRRAARKAEMMAASTVFRLANVLDGAQEVERNTK